MIRLIKICFWIAVVVFFLPEDATNDITTKNAIEVARAGIKDAGGFCTRNPDACLQGRDAVAGLGQKTMNTARSIYDYLQENSSDDAKVGVEQVLNSADMLSIEQQIKFAQSTGQTLSVSDLNIDFASLNTQ